MRKLREAPKAGTESCLLWSHAWYTAEAQQYLLTKPNGPGSPTAQLAVSAPGMGGKESV